MVLRFHEEVAEASRLDHPRIARVRASGQDAGDHYLILDLARDGELVLTVYDLQGRLVRELVAGEVLTAGSHRVVWDGRDRRGRPAPSGVYLVQGRSGSSLARTRLVRVR